MAVSYDMKGMEGMKIRPLQFETTRWSVVLAAGSADVSARRRALETLCDAYWYPLYAYIRRQGHNADDARDLTQGFFTALLERRDFEALRRERGRFRAFLRALVAWSPVIALVLWLGRSPIDRLTRLSVSPLLPIGAVLVILAAGAAWTIVRRSRGPHDAIAGTWVVPR
jgi:hypothetical protein